MREFFRTRTVLLLTLVVGGCGGATNVETPTGSAGNGAGGPTISTPGGMTISSVTGGNGTLTITGSGFGAGPVVQLYDDFEGGAIGQPVSLTSSIKGTWDLYTPGPLPTHDAIAHSGNSSARMYDKQTLQLHQGFNPGIREILLSYWVFVPPGTPFPGYNGGVKTFSTVSSWKFTWIFDQSYQGFDADLCLPTWAGSGQLFLAGNDMNLITNLNHTTWWDWDNWMRIAVWLKANETDPTLPGTVEFQTISAGKGLYDQRWTTPVFDTDGPALKQFRNLTIPGWVAETSSVDTHIVYDDIYIAVGQGAVARVEIGDQPTYAASKTLEIQLPTAWSDNSISVNVHLGAVASVQSGYLYVTDANGVVNATGYPLAGIP